jgi:tRNA threonylcarbamoyladenosine biosynthesis protein TsaB
MRGERYVAPFHRDDLGFVTPMGSLARVPAAEVARVAATLGATPIGPLEPLAASPRAAGAAALLDAILRGGPVTLDTWEPAYGRLAEAQVKWEAAHGRALGA